MRFQDFIQDRFGSARQQHATRFERATFAFAGFGVGMLLMYFLDPARGRTRRALVRNKGVHAQKVMSRVFAARGRDVMNRTRGFVAESRSRLHGDELVSDDTLARRVRSEMGHHVSNSGVIRVSVRDGVVTLSGPVREGEEAALVSCVKSIRGVKDVHPELSLHRMAEETVQTRV